MYDALDGNILAEKFDNFKVEIAAHIDKLKKTFITVKTVLAKLRVSMLDQVDVSELQKITDWNKINNLDDLMTKYPAAYSQFVDLMQKYNNESKPAQKIIAEIEKTLSDSSSSGLSTGAIVAIAVIVPLVVLTLFVGGYFYYKNQKQKQKTE